MLAIVQFSVFIYIYIPVIYIPAILSSASSLSSKVQWFSRHVLSGSRIPIVCDEGSTEIYSVHEKPIIGCQ